MLKFPTLVSHFLEHQQRQADIGVLEFLCMHYGGNDQNDNDDERDKQLPYKSVEMHAHHSSFIPLAKSISIRCQEYLPLEINYPVLKDNYLPEPALSSLFRPPRA